MAGGHRNIAPIFLAIHWTFFGIVTIIIGLRLYSRAFRLGKLHKDDYMMIVAWLLSISYGAILTDAVDHGLGRHLDQIPEREWPRIGAEVAFSHGAAITVPWLVRLSFSCTLLIIIRGTRHDRVRWLIRFIVMLETIVSLVNIIIIYSNCGKHSRPNGLKFVCRPTAAVDYASYMQSATNCLSNIVLASIPFWLIRKMSLPKDVKNGTIVLSILGFACSLAAIAKAIETRAMSWGKKDITYDFIMAQLAMTLENSILMILCSLPLLRPLYKRHRQRGTLASMTSAGRSTPPPPSFALLERTGNPQYPREKDTESHEAGCSVGEEPILAVPSITSQDDSLKHAAVPPGRIKVHTAVDVTYEQARDDVDFATDELVQQRIMFGV